MRASELLLPDVSESFFFLHLRHFSFFSITAKTDKQKLQTFELLRATTLVWGAVWEPQTGAMKSPVGE